MSYYEFKRSLWPDDRKEFSTFPDLVDIYDDNYECGDITDY